MKDFITYDIESELKQDEVYQIINNKLPGFRWRKGDSDSQGEYISGRNQDGVTIKAWLETNAFIEMSVCFTGVWENHNDRSTKKEQLIELIEKKLIPVIGKNLIIS